MDFTLKTYEKLLNSLQSRGFSFMTFAQYIEAKSSTQQINKSTNQPAVKLTSKSQKPTANSKHLIILRHDVEARYPNALRMAQIEHQLGIKGSYYFRVFPKSGNEEIIKQIAALGHEIGYHYDDLTACKGDHQKALERFQKNLAYLRQFAPVTTITMEGAPLSKYDNRDLWTQPLTPQILESLNFESSSAAADQILKSSNPQIFKSSNLQIFKSTIPYSLFSINAEPYFDLNFNEILYLTDTGRCWDGHLYNVRDKATKENPVTNPHFLQLRYHTTHDIIKAVENDQFPSLAMLNFHPQRWNDKPIPWLKELLWQNVKNQGKRLLLLKRGNKGS